MIFLKRVMKGKHSKRIPGFGAHLDLRLPRTFCDRVFGDSDVDGSLFLSASCHESFGIFHGGCDGFVRALHPRTVNFHPIRIQKVQFRASKDPGHLVEGTSRILLNLVRTEVSFFASKLRGARERLN